MLQAQTRKPARTFNRSANIRTDKPTPNSMMARVREADYQPLLTRPATPPPPPKPAPPRSDLLRLSRQKRSPFLETSNLVIRDRHTEKGVFSSPHDRMRCP